MAKSLGDILKGVNKSKVVPGTTGDDPGVDYAGKMKDERDFVAKHSIEKHEDRVGNGDDVYKASKIKQSKDDKHGHTPDPKAKTVYKQANEEAEHIVEAMTSKHKKLAYDVHKQLKRDQPMSSGAGLKLKADHNLLRKKYGSDWRKKAGIIEEAKDPREYGYEGEMAMSQIKSIMNHSDQLMKMLKPDTDMPEWVQSKITLANDYIQTAADYFATEMNEDSKCNMTEAGTMCEVHGMKSCDSKEEKSASDKEPRYNGKKKEGRQLITDKKKIEEREMTASEKKKENKLKDKYDDSSMKASMQKQYGDEKGKQVYFAYIRKKAMKSEQADTHISTPSTVVGDTGRV